MTAETVLALAQRAADIADTVGDVQSIGFAEMGDGSRRHFAHIFSFDAVNDLEQEFRVITPAPEGGSSWTWAMTGWTTEVRVGDTWRAFEGVT